MIDKGIYQMYIFIKCGQMCKSRLRMCIWRIIAVIFSIRC